MELHPVAAEARGLANGEWVSIETPEGMVRARARLNDDLDSRVVVGEHGWWQPKSTGTDINEIASVFRKSIATDAACADRLDRGFARDSALEGAGFEPSVPP